MKNLLLPIIAITTTFMSQTAFCTTYTDPFGTAMGQSKSDIEEKVQLKGKEFLYTSTKAPSMNPPMDSYNYKITPQRGLCYIGGQTKDIQIGQNMLNEFTNRYGSPEKDDKGRFAWGLPIHNLDHNLGLVTLIIPHRENRVSSVGVEFVYKNNEECTKEMHKAWGLE